MFHCNLLLLLNELTMTVCVWYGVVFPGLNVIAKLCNQKENQAECGNSKYSPALWETQFRTYIHLYCLRDT